jgi:hypothetical protein
LSIRAGAFVEQVSSASGAAEPKEHGMTVTSPTTVTTPVSRLGESLVVATIVVGAAAAAVTTAVAAAIRAAGVPLAVDGEMIPLAGFAQMTFLGAVIGGVLLAVCNRRGAAPRRRFLQITTALVVLSCVPSVALPPDAATKFALVMMHLLAAAIIVPVLVRHADA